MRKVIVILIVTACICCKDKKVPETGHENKLIIPQLFLNKGLEYQLREWINSVTTEMDSITGHELCYTVEFFVDSMGYRFLGKDTAIVLSYYSPIGSYPGFKGVASFGGNCVAIVDEKDAGVRYYNPDYLEKRPLEIFKGGPVVADRRAIRLFKLNNGKLMVQTRFIGQ